MPKPVDLQSAVDAVVLAVGMVTGPWPVEETSEVGGFVADLQATQRLQAATADLLALLDVMPRDHVVTLRERDWVLEHPLSCRRVDLPLSACPYNDQVLDGWVAPHLGRYRVVLVNGGLTVAEPVPPTGHAAELAVTLDATPSSEEASGGGDQGSEAGSDQERQDGESGAERGGHSDGEEGAGGHRLR